MTDAPELIRVGLSEKQAMASFEAKFGVDQISRTRKQWKALVNQYGYPTCIAKENMTKAQIKAKCKNG
jgi:hypothetical protein